MSDPRTDPILRFPEFYGNRHVRSILAPQRLWTVSDFDKRPVDIVSALDGGPVCPRCNQHDCNEVHGARLSDADTQLMTLGELTAALPNARNVATHIDWRSSGLMVLDIEPGCPPDVTDQLLRMVTGNTASPQPSALYAEMSGSGRGYHLVLPAPTNIALFPRAVHATKLQHPQRWYEVLLYHWITFSRNPIPTQRLVSAASNTRGEELTWEGVFGQLVQIAPGGTAAGDRTSGEFDQVLSLVEGDLDPTTMSIDIGREVIDVLSREPAKDLHDDFAGDTSRWEMSRLIRIAAISQNKLHIRQSISRITGIGTQDPEQDKRQLLSLVHHVARETLPPRMKHDERRAGTTYLLKRCAEALEHLDI